MAQANHRGTLAGHIMWLPLREDIPPHLDPNLDDGCYNHPVVIMSKKPFKGNTVRIFLITSLAGRDFKVDHTPDWVWRHHYFPIAPSPPHPESGIQLCLADGCANLLKNSYVTTRNGPYAVDLEALRPYSHRGPVTAQRVLSKKSFRVLSQHSLFIDESGLDVEEFPRQDAEKVRARRARMAKKAKKKAAEEEEETEEEPATREQKKTKTTTATQRLPTFLKLRPSWPFVILGLAAVFVVWLVLQAKNTL